jgi:signal transduction histidine kinase
MALREFRSAGIDPGRDCARLTFLDSHTAVVRAVVSGEADIGTVRTDTLERMAAAGEIRMDAIRIIPADAEPEHREKLTASSRLLLKIIASVRNLAYDLRLPGLDGKGLVKALEVYCEEASQKVKVTVDFQSAGMSVIKLD